MKTLILVVLYNKAISKSFTLKSLSLLNNRDFDLIIINNGPFSILDEFKSYNIEINGTIDLVEYLWNKPLSNLYNDVISSNSDYYRFVLLDDDTQVPNKFIDDLNSNFLENISMHLPLIKNISDNKIYYPRVDNVVINDKVLLNSISDYNEFHSIGSGLVIYRDLIDVFKKYNLKLFDERFVFYGVDVSIFRRIMFLKKKYGVIFEIRIVSLLNHSLSEHEANFSDWKKKEMLYADALMIRHYSENKSILVYSFLKFLLKNILSCQFKNLIFSILVFIKGAHPRSAS
ncbi:MULTISPECIES: glycosyltransferase family 2 protein [Acinetobacter]|uniref:glycosyltransferase family 2 protein n=1 Tax=Acinetobacter TaxID=469 RepID=UPI000F6843C7|nr:MULTISPECIES: hypothetical protein [Acinetobacter]AWD70005.2 hypothetical protein C0119_06960 [Acinetobacter schindleri]MDH2019232.1 glycosyl transferase [Acinetobacter ursingii]MDH2071707.1 glycosyl transferase [Acinetobacter ursingii]